MNILYISYDGALDPLGRSQVVPYVTGLASLGHRFDLITFEKPERWGVADERSAMQARLAEAGIEWHPLRYHRRVSPVATAYDLSRARLRASRVSRTRPVDLVHARSYPSSLVATRVARRLGTPFVFDMRGLWADERVDGGIWPAGGTLYRTTKRFERSFLRQAAAVVTLTEASVPVVQELLDEAGGRASIHVIPTSVDLGLFRPAPAQDPFTVAYSGSVGTWYLLDEMVAFSAAVVELTGGRVRFVVNGESEAVLAAAARTGLGPGCFSVQSVGHEQVPMAIAGASATFAFIKPAPSKVASAATKVSESLAMGLPVALNRGVGDGADLVVKHRVGVVVDPYDPSSFPDAARQLVALAREPGVAQRCRSVAEQLFDLDGAVRRYDRLYAAVAAASGGVRGRPA